MSARRLASRLLLLSSALLLAPSAPSGANPGGGGGGGGSVPSVSAPQFDAADEYRKGVEALKAQSFAEAKKSFNRVLSAAPRDANTHYLAGLANAGLSDWKAARRHFERAVKGDGNLIQARQQLAITYVKMGDRPKAEGELAALKLLGEKCAESCPQAPALKSAVAAVTAELGAGPTAQLDLQPGLLFASAAAGDGAYLQAVGLINEGRYEAAIASLDSARATFGPHPDVLTYLGFANRKLGRFDTAEAYYRQALAATPDHKGATEYYGELMVERGDLAGASRMLARLETNCAFGCAEADELRRWIEARRSPAS